VTGPIWVSFGFWVVGVIVILSGGYMSVKLQKAGEAFKERAERTAFRDPSAGIAYRMGSGLIDLVPWYYLRVLFLIVGAVIIAIGFVPLAFIGV